MVNGWDWNGQEEQRCTVVKRVDSTAVYTNQEGEIVIRQRDAMEDGDALIRLSTAAARALIDALSHELETPFTPG